MSSRRRHILMEQVLTNVGSEEKVVHLADFSATVPAGGNTGRQPARQRYDCACYYSTV